MQLVGRDRTDIDVGDVAGMVVGSVSDTIYVQG